MDLDKFGDSYDIVKQSTLRWLSPCGTWVAHPMFTGAVDPSQAKAFSDFLGVTLVTTAELTPDRDAFLKAAKGCSDHLFLDPDTGLRAPASSEVPRSQTRKYLMAQEFLAIAQARPDKLTLVYDQSIDRRYSVRSQLESELRWLADNSIQGCAYESHACFILVSASKQVLDRAADSFLLESRLPPARLVRVNRATLSRGVDT